jgi:aminoglycoside phosphotransferase (APT) family kinase protein
VNEEPGRLLARGRDGDIFEFGAGRVLRRSRDGRSLEREARVMEYLGELGYPVPHIDEVRADGREIVMERIDGPLLMDTVTRDPRRLLRAADLLADLHDQLHAIAAPDWLPHLDDGDAILHLDLHPLNVMMDGDRAVVIDWANARIGNPLTDVATSYVLITTPNAPVPHWQQIAIRPARVWLARRLARRYRGRAFDEQLVFAATLKQLDSNMAPDEIARMAKLARKTRTKLAAS